MLDPRIYRMSLLLPVLALLVLAFSLVSQPGARQSSLAPGAFDGSGAARTMDMLAREFPQRSPGSPGDGRLAARIQATLGAGGGGFQTSRDTFVARTAQGERPLVNVLATRPGTASGDGAVVVVAPRSGPGRAGMSATAVLLGLSRTLGGETLQRTVVLASVDGVAGARRLAQSLGQPVDSVLVLGDVADAGQIAPVVLPWSGRDRLAPAALRNTISGAVAAQTGVAAGSPELLSQLAHLAFPLTLSAQAPFVDRDVPAVELSLSGERGPRAGELVGGAGRLGAIGRAVVASVSALDTTGPVGTPSSYLIVDGQMVPAWAISLFVLALILPVVLTAVDGLARARRRRYPLGGALRAVLVTAAPFLAAGVVVAVGGAVGALPASLDAFAPGTVTPSGGAIAVMAVALLAALGGAALVRPAWTALTRPQSTAVVPARRARDARPAPPDAAWGAMGAATLLVVCVVAILLWIGDPFAAALLIPALHLWLWALDADLPMPAPARVFAIMLGVLPTVGLVLFVAHTLGFGPAGVAWEAVLLIAGHAVSWPAAILWSLALGCLASAVGTVLVHARASEPVAVAATIRGPATYAGPGSLGATKSALRR